jgi:hypothetical protein
MIETGNKGELFFRQGGDQNLLRKRLFYNNIARGAFTEQKRSAKQLQDE